MAIDLKQIRTEGQNQNTINIDELETEEVLKKINEEDQKVALAVQKAIPTIAKLADEIVQRILKGGRMIYVGAGTSGRIGILDAVECPPTFGVSYEEVKCHMAGGENAFVKAIEGAEDNKEMGAQDLENDHLSENDVVIGIAASGRTPYVIGAIEYALKIGALTASIATCANSVLASLVKYKVEAVTGEEVIAGSTRMKSGTAQKMICNMLSTTVMIKLGHVYNNLMIDVKATNEKLVSRMESILATITGLPKEEASKYIKEYGTCKKAAFAVLSGVTSKEKVDYYLNKANGNLKKALALKKND